MKFHPKLCSSLFLCLALLLGGCERNASFSDETAQRHQVRGIVRGLPPDHQTVEIEHEDIPGFMPSMTMPFSVRSEKERGDVRIGDAIAFRLNLTERDSYIDQVRKIDAAEVKLPKPKAAPPSVASSRLREGDAMPAFHLVDETGQPLDLQTFRGRPFVLTFIFTRCPIPNFCPRMAEDFAELQKEIKAAASDPLASTRLLSISFDPAHDTPAVLGEYGRAEKADPAVWKFATGSAAEISSLTKAFSVLVQPEGGGISHSLATALIGKDGRIEKIWRGNSWKPADVVEQVNGQLLSLGVPASGERVPPRKDSPAEGAPASR